MVLSTIILMIRIREIPRRQLTFVSHPANLIIGLFLLSVVSIFGQVFPESCQRSPLFLTEFPECSSGEFRLVFNDEFDTGFVDTNAWENVVWRQGSSDVDQHLQYFSLDNAIVSNGTLKIVAKKDTITTRAVYWKPDSELLEDGRPNYRTYYHTSASLWTKEKFFYGKYEARCRLPDGVGLWPAFWMYDGGVWNELDVFDNYRNTNDFITGVGHDFDRDGDAEGCHKQYHNLDDLTDWHIYTCIFDFDRIIWMVDGYTIRTYYRFSSTNGNVIKCGDEVSIGTYLEQQAFPRDSMSIVVNLSLQSGDQAPDETTLFPAIFEIDYVRFYEFADSRGLMYPPFPNPTNDKVYLKSDFFIEKVSVMDLAGKIVLEKERIPSGVGSLSFARLTRGIYCE